MSDRLPANRSVPIDPRVDIGHVHLKVADLERALGFYCGVLGFELTQRYGDRRGVRERGRIPSPHRAQYLGEPGRIAPAVGKHRALPHRHSLPRSGSLADALRRVLDAGVRLDGASDHGVSEALYLRDPDDNGVELYRDRPREEWPRDAAGALVMSTGPLNIRALLREAP